jgi:hypothetical protein
MNIGRLTPFSLARAFAFFALIATAVPAPRTLAEDSPCNPIYYDIKLDSSDYCPGTSGNRAYILGSWANATYQWSITSGTIDSGQGTNSVSFSVGTVSGGGHHISITVTAPQCGSPMYDSDMFGIAVPVEIHVDAPEEVCAASRGHVARVVDPTSWGYRWTIRNGSILSSNTDATEVEFTSPWSGEVELSATLATGCWTPVPKFVRIRPSLSGPIEADNVCAGTTGNIARVRDAGPGATYEWSIDNGTITSPLPHRSSIEFTAGAPDRSSFLRAEVNAPDGCSLSLSRIIKVSPPPSAALDAPSTLCAASVARAVVPDAGPGAAYVWTIQNGSIASPAPHGREVEFLSGGAGEETILGVTVENADGCAETASRRVALLTTPGADIDASPVCANSQSNVATVADAGAGATYEWTAANATITSSPGPKIEFTAGAGPDPVTLTATVTSAESCAATRSASLPVDNCDEFCTLEQSFYGTAEGQFNAYRAEWLIGTLLPVTVGSGNNVLVLPPGAEECVLARLPATGPPAALQPGHQILGPTACAALEPLDENGKLRNGLLGEMIALALNIELQRNKLLDATLCPAFETQRALPGSGGLLGDNDDRPDPGADGIAGPNCAVDPVTCPSDDPVELHLIPPPVLEALDRRRLSRTGFGLLHLGNRALGGESFADVSLEDIQRAIASVNHAFSNCRFLRGCVDAPPPPPPPPSPEPSRTRPAKRGGGS